MAGGRGITVASILPLLLVASFAAAPSASVDVDTSRTGVDDSSEQPAAVVRQRHLAAVSPFWLLGKAGGFVVISVGGAALLCRRRDGSRACKDMRLMGAWMLSTLASTALTCACAEVHVNIMAYFA